MVSHLVLSVKYKRVAVYHEHQQFLSVSSITINSFELELDLGDSLLLTSCSVTSEPSYPPHPIRIFNFGYPCLLSYHITNSKKCCNSMHNQITAYVPYVCICMHLSSFDPMSHKWLKVYSFISLV